MKMTCAGCRYFRRRCPPDCFVSPYFPGNDPQRFACVRKVYGTYNLIKMLQKVPPNQRAIAAETLYQEANSRLEDPVYGCVGDITSLNQQIHDAQDKLAEVRAQIAVFTGLNTQNDQFVGDNVPSYGAPGLVDVPEAEGAYGAPGLVEVPVAEDVSSNKLGNNVPSYGAPGLVEVPVVEGNKKKQNYKGVQQTAAGNWIAQVHLGTFKTAEDAAKAYDNAALKLHGHKARLNFPDREAFPYIPYADSAQLLSSGENNPSKRRRDSQSAPGSVSAPLSHKDGFNQTPSVLTDLSELDNCLEHDGNSSMMSLLLPSLDIPNQQTLGELTYGSASQSTLDYNILQWLHQKTASFIQATEGNVEAMSMEHLCLRKSSPCQTEPMQNGRSVHCDGSKLVVNAIEIKEESQDA